jgi:hypothetical protein
MRRIGVLLSAVLVAGCARSEQQAEETAEQAAAPAAIALADLAGTWNVNSMSRETDSVLTTYTLVATADTTGWMVTFPGRQPLPARVVMVHADSVVVEVGPYESVLRPGMMVSTRSVSRLVDGKMVGLFEAHYQTATADSVLLGKHEGVRAQ